MQSQVPDSVSKMVIHTDKKKNFCSLNNVFVSLQEGAGFLEEHVYMAGDHTA